MSGAEAEELLSLRTMIGNMRQVMYTYKFTNLSYRIWVEILNDFFIVKMLKFKVI